MYGSGLFRVTHAHSSRSDRDLSPVSCKLRSITKRQKKPQKNSEKKSTKKLSRKKRNFDLPSGVAWENKQVYGENNWLFLVVKSNPWIMDRKWVIHKKQRGWADLRLTYSNIEVRETKKNEERNEKSKLWEDRGRAPHKMAQQFRIDKMLPLCTLSTPKAGYLKSIISLHFFLWMKRQVRIRVILFVKEWLRVSPSILV